MTLDRLKLVVYGTKEPSFCFSLSLALSLSLSGARFQYLVDDPPLGNPETRMLNVEHKAETAPILLTPSIQQHA